MTITVARPRDQASKPRIDLETCHRMTREGAIEPDAGVELIGGEIIEMAPIGHDRAITVDDLVELDEWRAHRSKLRLRIQGIIRLDEHNEPEPDLVILRRREDLYHTGHPRPEDVLFLIEVADSSLLLDRTCKVPLYARHGIREVWIVDLMLRVVVDPVARVGRGAPRASRWSLPAAGRAAQRAVEPDAAAGDADRRRLDPGLRVARQPTAASAASRSWRRAAWTSGSGSGLAASSVRV